MAKVELVSYLSEINGRIEDVVLYASGGKEYMRRYVKPRNPKTESQQANRKLFAEAMASWKLLTSEEKKKYRQKTRRLNMHPHNLYIREYIKAHSIKAGDSVAANPSADSFKAPGFYKSGIPPVSLHVHTEAAPFYTKYSSFTPLKQGKSLYHRE